MLIAVSGLIGAGKTTLIQRLDGYKFFEPVESNPYLVDYYSDPNRWCFPMQMHLLHERYRMIKKAYYAQLDADKHAIMDRSIYEDWCFASMGADAGYMTEREMQTYEKAHEDYCSDLIPFPDLVLHINAPINVLIEHIKKRDRSCEADMMAEYLEKLQAKYDVLLPILATKCPVVVLDGTQTETQVLHAAQQAVKDREEELKNRQPRYRGGC